MASTQPPDFFMRTIPGNYAGRWKGLVNMEASYNGEVYKECWQFKADAYDM